MIKILPSRSHGLENESKMNFFDIVLYTRHLVSYRESLQIDTLGDPEEVFSVFGYKSFIHVIKLYSISGESFRNFYCVETTSGKLATNDAQKQIGHRCQISSSGHAREASLWRYCWSWRYKGFLVSTK